MGLVSRRKVVIGTAAAAAVGAFGSRGRAQDKMPKMKLSLSWIPVGRFAYTYVAEKLGYWTRRGIDVHVERGFGSGDTCKQVALGHYEFGLADFNVMVKTASDGLPLTCIAMGCHTSQIGILSLKDSNIINPKDLEGKTLASTHGSTDATLWPGFTAATGIDASKVNIAYMGPELRFRALIDKKVDAIGASYSTDVPFFLAQKIPHNLMLYANYGMGMYSTSIITRRDRVQSNPAQVQAFVEGAMEGLKFTFLEPEKATDIHLEMVKEYAGEVTDREMIRFGILTNTATSLAKYLETQGLGYMERELVEATQEKIAKYQGLKTRLDPSSLYTNQFVGGVRLTADEWRKVYDSVRSYIL
ncbi:MAG: ABC transporter substrate-binding protein [Bradyrhizobium sp.]